MSKYLPQNKFSFVSSAPSLDRETFGVIRFSGIEGVSVPYEFDITLVSDNAEIDLDQMLSAPVKFTVHRETGADVDYHGILASFEQLHQYNEYIFYRAHLVPRLWWLGLSHHNQVFLQSSVPEIISIALRDAGLSMLDFEFRLRNTYKPLEYVCQYNENHLNYISRWTEREGIYYYFEQTDSFEKVIFTDSGIAHTDFPGEGDILYAPPTGFVEPERTEIVNSFICRHRQIPGKIQMRDYNYERPSLSISGTADVCTDGRGTDYLYGEHFTTPEEGKRLAELYAESHTCRKVEFVGESTIPCLRPGYTFSLHRHYRSSFNQHYLIIGISHEGNQVGYLLPSISEGLPGEKETIYYRNSFSAIPANVQYRPERKAVKPRIAGTIHARIDAEGSGQYAELDDQGRYKVRLPFDVNDQHGNGKASAWVRMMQPYAHAQGGMHFPLVKGTEVLLTFIDGDPDRPVIACADANPETPSPVTSKNQTRNVMRTAGGNVLTFDDTSGRQKITIEQANGNSITLETLGPDGAIRIADKGGNEIVVNDTGDDRGICARDSAGNEVLLDAKGGTDAPQMVLSQQNGNKIQIDGTKGSEAIRMVDASGNQIAMKGTPGDQGVEIVDACGNRIEMDATDANKGILLKDSYGNKVHLDAVQKILKLASPSHDSSIVLGRSIEFNTDSDQKSLVSADATFTCLGASSEVFIGVKAELSLAETFELYIGLKQELSMLAQTSFFLGFTSETRVGPKVEFATSESKTYAYGFKQTLATFLSSGFSQWTGALKTL